MNLHYLQLQSLARQRQDDLLREADQDRLADLLKSRAASETDRLAGLLKSSRAASETDRAVERREDVTVWRPRLASQAY